jgi:hypothetical protein
VFEWKRKPHITASVRVGPGDSTLPFEVVCRPGSGGGRICVGAS